MMNWISDMVWLAGEWFLLLGLSTLVGLGIGWFAWRRDPGMSQPPKRRSGAQATGRRSAGTISPVQDAEAAIEPDVIDLRTLTNERDALRDQRDRLRSQLREIEAMVGDEESRRRSRDPQEG